MPVRTEDLTDAERQLIASLPAPPPIAQIRSTNVWIVEWLPSGELQTGRLLHEWLTCRRPGWSRHYACANKEQVIHAIEEAIAFAARSNLAPVLHLEAHGGNHGIGLPDGSELLTWDELTTPLQHLNMATQCNLVLVVAACVGFAGVQALQRGPRAPAIALVGPDATVMADDLLRGAKAFYPRWMAPNPNFQDITADASRAAGTVTFELEPFAVLFHEALTEWLVMSLRPGQGGRRRQHLHHPQRTKPSLSVSEIDKRQASIPLGVLVDKLQRLWDEMFMIDLYPANRERFGVDMRATLEVIGRSHIG
jgi:hypothetical protein